MSANNWVNQPQLIHFAMIRRRHPTEIFHRTSNQTVEDWVLSDSTLNGPLSICSIYGISTNISPKNNPNVGKYTIYGA